MGLLYLLINILGEHAGKTFDKLNFKKSRIAPQLLVILVFFVMSVSLTLYILVTKQSFPHFTPIILGLVALIAVVSFAGNAFDYLSLKTNDISLREPLNDFAPIVAGLVGYALFPSEREPEYLLAFLLGAIIVYWGSHRRKLRKVQKKGMFYMLLATCLYSLLPSIYQFALEHLSPSYITLFRVTAVLALSVIFFPPPKNKRKLSPKKIEYSLLAGVFYAVSTVAGLYAIRELGVVLTMLLSLLGPFLSYSIGYFIFKENVRKGEMLSSFLLVILVAAPMLR